MTFIPSFETSLSNQTVMTENGALGYAGSGRKILDFFYKASTYRSCPEEIIIKDFAEAWLEDSVVAAKLLFFIGDIRQGLGERRTFKACLNWLVEHYPGQFKKLVGLIPEYSRWDVLIDFCFCSVPEVKACARAIVKAQLNEDIANAADPGKSISLLAKWMPSINTSSKQQVRRANILALDVLAMSPKDYRKTLSGLRSRLDVVEVKACARQWGEIDYNKVPSKANLKYKDAFLRHDTERRRGYLAALANNEEGVKINSSVAYPYDIVHRYFNGCHYYLQDEDDATLEEMWKALPDYVHGECSTICVVDGSASMTNTIGTSGVTALEVANSLGIYLSERMTGEFADKFITFSKNPQLVKFDHGWTLRQKLAHAYEYDEISNTDIEKTFQLILDTAVQNHLAQEELPKTILVLSDMEFDGATCDCYERGAKQAVLFETIRKRFVSAGYKMPRLVFWNLNSRTGAIPMKENEQGVVLVSGFSPVVMEMVLSGMLDPFKALLFKLNSERYSEVEKSLLSA